MALKDLFKNAFDFTKILNPVGNSVLGIDIGSSSIKVVELEKKKGKAVLKTYGEIALGPYGGSSIGQVVNVTNEKISEALHDILKEARTTTTNSGVAIPFRSSLVSLIEMPVLPEKQLEEVIPIEARKYIPVPISEVTLDWWIIPKDDTATSRIVKKNDENAPPPLRDKNDVLVVSIHNEILSDYNNIVQQNKLDTSFFEIEMFSTLRALVNEEKFPSVVMDIGASGTKLYVVEKGILRNSHILNKGSKDITSNLAHSFGVSNQEAEKIKRNIKSLKEADQKSVADILALTIDGILAETENFIKSYEHRSGHAVERIVLTGGGAALVGFMDLVKKRFNLDVVMGNSFSKVEIPIVLGETLKATGLEFAVAVGIALRKIQELT